MANYKENYEKDFTENLTLLAGGIARIERRRDKNWYENLKDSANALIGGWTPSLDPGISEVKSKTNIYSGAEAMNQGAREILDNTASKYSTIYTQNFANFYKISEDILKEKQGEDFSFENEFSSNENLDNIKNLFIKLKTSDDTVGLLGGDENPRNLVIKILEELTIILNDLSNSIKSNFSSLSSIANDLANDQLSDHLTRPLLEVCSKIYIFNEFTKSFTLAQAHRRGERKRETLATPTGTAGTSGAGSGTAPGAFNYSAEGFSLERMTSLENTERSNFKLSSPGPSGDGWIVPLILSRRDGESISSAEVEKINDNPIDFIRLLIRLDVLEPVNIDADLIIRNVKSLTARSTSDNSKLYVYIELNTEFKEKAYNEVEEDGAVIFQINNVETASPTGLVVKADSGSNLFKKADTATTPYYETVSPSGERISFTPSDLVRGIGKLKDSSGKTFKPKKIKGKSLANKVMSKNFGKIRK